MIKLCIFDLDGTLINSIHSISNAMNATLKDFGLDQIEPEQYKKMVGNDAGTLIDRVLQFQNVKDTSIYHRFHGHFLQNYQQHAMDQVAPYEGISPLLKQLKEMGIFIAVLTNKPHPRAIENITEIWGKGYFHDIQGEIPGRAMKPDPECALEIAACFEISPKDIIYLGDTDTDMMTGKAAGMITIGVTWGFRDREELEKYQPAHIIDHPSDLLKIIEEYR